MLYLPQDYTLSAVFYSKTKVYGALTSIYQCYLLHYMHTSSITYITNITYITSITHIAIITYITHIICITYITSLSVFCSNLLLLCQHFALCFCLPIFLKFMPAESPHPYLHYLHYQYYQHYPHY